MDPGRIKEYLCKRFKINCDSQLPSLGKPPLRFPEVPTPNQTPTPKFPIWKIILITILGILILLIPLYLYIHDVIVSPDKRIGILPKESQTISSGHPQ